MRKFMILIMVLAAILATNARDGSSDTGFVCAVTKGEWVWLRAEPSADADQIGTLRYGVEGEIHEIRNLYARITTVDGREGWCAVQYLLIPINEEVWTVDTIGSVNVREKPPEQPGMKLRLARKIRAGAKVSVLGWRYDCFGELWAHVFHGGYVKACYLAKSE